MLKEFEKGLASRLKSLSMEEFQFVDFEDENNINGVSNNLERY